MSDQIQWSSWASLARPQEAELGRPFAQHNPDGRLEVVAAGSGGLFNSWQVSPNGRNCNLMYCRAHSDYLNFRDFIDYFKGLQPWD